MATEKDYSGDKYKISSQGSNLKKESQFDCCNNQDKVFLGFEWEQGSKYWEAKNKSSQDKVMWYNWEVSITHGVR